MSLMYKGFSPFSEQNTDGTYSHWMTVNGQKIVKVDYDRDCPYMSQEIFEWFVTNDFPDRTFFDKEDPIYDEDIFDDVMSEVEMEINEKAMSHLEEMAYQDIRKWALDNYGVDITDADEDFDFEEILTKYWNSKLT